MHCSRELIALHHEYNDCEYFLALDAAERLLAGGRSDYSWTSQLASTLRVFLRFSRQPPALELVFRPYDHFDEEHHEIISVPMYIQETMIRPTCTLSIDPDDLTYAECDWRAYLGTVQAPFTGADTVEVCVDDANRLVRRSSRPMLLLSQGLPTTYIPREWLAEASPLGSWRIR